MSERLYLSPPHMDGDEIESIREAFDSNWITSLGPALEGFERDIEDRLGCRHALALSSGTAALHLALHHLGVGPGSTVLCSSLTFIASASPIVQLGASPVFIDSESSSWNMDPDLLAAELEESARKGQRPAAVVVADIFGQCADYGRIERICRIHEVPLLTDAAEALGARCRDQPAGTFGLCGILSFNGNKIVTTSGGGMLISDDGELINHARHLATQARDPAPHYQHTEVGYNYRLSNLLAAMGRAQLGHLDDRVMRRRGVFDRYQAGLGSLPGIGFMPEPEWSFSNRWLTCVTVDEGMFGADREVIRNSLEARNAEARPIWKPLHMQPVFEECRVVGGAMAEKLFRDGLCLPSGSSMTPAQQAQVIEIVRNCAGSDV
ncbi:MAG: pyridoxal phosphate-dependent aminotransferase [Acidobacteria bacterium]|nr:pyridoxal phosphate-dependent aminotransferase [Acidobacteriota bacterium]